MDKLVFVFFLVMGAPAAFAALGTDVASVEQDRQALGGSHQAATQTKSSYSIKEMTAHGNVIREYVDANGKIFAVTWKGITEPNLTVLLGQYYSEYHSGMSAIKKTQGRAPITLDTAQITVHKWGHMRAIQGRAFVKSLMPSGVKAEELQ